MNQEVRKAGKQNPAFRNQSISWIPGFLIVVSVYSALGITSRLVAGDAVAIGYNTDGVWTDVTYYRSATAKGGKDYRTSAHARAFALRDVRRRSQYAVAKATILSSSDLTGFIAVACGQDKSGRDIHGL